MKQWHWCGPVVLAAALLGGCDLRGAPTGRTPDGGAAGPNAAGPGQSSPPGGEPADDLLRARAGFKTQVRPNPNYQPDGPPDQPPPKLFRVVKYPSPAGELVAYLSPDPGDGKKHPVLIYAHGGFGGVNGFAFGREEFSPFRAAGFVLFCPSWRGENENPGRYEMFYGEVDDALAAVEYVRKLPYADPDRVYMLGHSTGGTVTLLTAEASPHLRAAFSCGGAPDLTRADYGNTPFNRARDGEVRLRSAVNFVRGLKAPTFYFEGERDPGYIPDARRMETLARAANVPFTAFFVKGATHFNIVRPVSALLADKLKADTGPRCNLTLTADEVDRAFAKSSKGR